MVVTGCAGITTTSLVLCRLPWWSGQSLTNVYHITHVKNLEAMITRGGLLPDRMTSKLSPAPISIGYGHIKERRMARTVPVGPGGTLGDYVPLYFAPRSPMLYSISQGNVPTYQEGQGPIVHLVASAEAIAVRGLSYVLTDGHADVALTRFYDSLAELNKVDWPLMRAQYWRDTIDDPDRKRRRQAEMLVHRFLPWDLIVAIGVQKRSTGSLVLEAIGHASHQPPVAVRPDWYYSAP